jgi:hypothetical protein
MNSTKQFRHTFRFFTFVVLCALGGTLTAAETNKSEESKPPGVVIDHRAAGTRQYIGSPSLAILPSGNYVASHDWFGPGSTQNRTVVFASHDKGQTWKQLTEIEGQWWSTLFFHGGALYLMGTSRDGGYAVIRRSTDGGTTWTTPRDGNSGLLLGDGKYHCAPVPVVTHDGRLWRAMENVSGPGGWGRDFRAFMMSAPVDADLLNATNWTISNYLQGNAEWLDGHFGGWLEGNAVVTPDGQIVDILRVDYRVGVEKAAIISISANGKRATFDPKTGFIDFPGGCKKFTIRYDPQSKSYWSLSNYVPEAQRNQNPERTRNTLALINSSDLKSWSVRSIILQHPDSAKHGFQYVDWLFEGNDIIAAVRTAFDDGLGGANNQHDANYLTFHRLKNFRGAASDEAESR